MKNIKMIMFTVIMLVIAFTFISCNSSKKTFNNSVNESVNYYKNVFITSENDDSGINPMANEDDDNQLNNGINSGERVNGSNGKEDDNGEKTDSTGARKNKTVDDNSGKENGKTPEGNNGSNGGKNNSSYKVGDTVIENKDDGLSEEEKKQAEENERLIEAAIEEKFVQYMPVFTHRVIKLVSNQYGASVAVATELEFETYVARLKAKNFEKNIVREGNCFKADCINGFHVILEVDKDSRLILTIYESEKFFK